MSPREIVAYLIERGLLQASELVAGSLRLTERARRHQGFIVQTRRGPGFFLKQDQGPTGAAEIEREAAWYHHLQTAPGAKRFAQFLPACRAYDPDRHLLVLDLCQGARTLAEHQEESGRFPRAPAAAVGRALAALHRARPAGGPARPPWVLRVHRPRPEDLWQHSPADLELLKFLQRSRPLAEHFDSLAAAWRATALIHGDLRWENVLVLPAARSRPGPGIRLVDFELAGPGDPAWDVAGMFASYLGAWVRSIPFADPEDAGRFVAAARFPLEGMRPALRSFWAAYARASRLAPAEDAPFLLRATRYAAAHLVRMSLEEAYHEVRLPHGLRFMVRLALNILERPGDAAPHLLGVTARKGKA